MISTLIVSTILMITPVKNDTTKLVSMLSWESFEIHSTTYINKVALVDSASNEIIEIGKSATPFLLVSILDSNKGVAIHLILTKMWEPDSFKVNLDYSHLYGQEDVTSVKFSANHLTWKTTDEGGNLIEPEALQKIKNYWQERLPQKYTPN